MSAIVNVEVCSCKASFTGSIDEVREWRAYHAPLCPLRPGGMGEQAMLLLEKLQ